MNHENSSAIDRFVEKPTEYVSNKINAGIYIFNPRMLNRIELKPMSIEKEVFPFMARDKQLHSMDLDGFWMDVGQPKDYLTGTCLYLASQARVNPKSLASGPYIIGNALIHPSAKIGSGCKIGPNVVLGPNVVIGDGVRLTKCVVLEGVTVKDHSWIRESIIGWHSTIGRWVRFLH